MPIYRVYGTQYHSYEIWVEAEDHDSATKIVEDAPQEAWLYSGEDCKIYPSEIMPHEGSDTIDKNLLYKPKEASK